MSLTTIAFLMGIIAGLRAMTPLAAVSWAGKLGILPLQNTFLAFLGYQWAPWICSLAAVGELINDKLPKTPSRTAPPSFITRVVMGALAGIAVTSGSGALVVGACLGAVGAVVGTLGGYYVRKTLVRAIGGKDLPIALLEDLVAVGGAFLLMRSITP